MATKAAQLDENSPSTATIASVEAPRPDPIAGDARPGAVGRIRPMGLIGSVSAVSCRRAWGSPRTGRVREGPDSLGLSTQAGGA
jgi:hypothetical protein